MDPWWRKRAAGAMVLAALAGLACAPTHTIEPRPGSPPATESCFNLRRVYSFTPLHGRYVYLREGPDKHYLLTLDTIYPHLKVSSRITIEGAWGTVCSETGAILVFSDYGRLTRCRIVRVEAVASKEAAEQIVAERTTPRPKG